MDGIFAKRTARVKPSTIREILEVATRPEVISFAGGLPAPELFPVAEMRAACERALAENGSAALQYGASEGLRPLREYLQAEMARRGAACPCDHILISTGSQQALDLLGKILLDPGDVVLTESPTYLAAIQAFQYSEPRFVPAPTDGDGLIPEALPELIAKYRPKFLYTIPNFQNPSGVTLSARRRRDLYEICAERDLLIVEDDPYGRLRYAGDDIPPLKTLDERGLVVYLSTFSKTIAPGLRIGWIAADPRLLRPLTVAKQAADLHTSTFAQHVVYCYLRDNRTEEHIARIRAAYGQRYAAMDEALRAEMPAGFSWTHPEGGMFLWVTGPEGLDTEKILPAAIERRVAFVPGRDFFPDRRGGNCMRLNFSNAAPDRIREGIARLADLCRAEAIGPTP